MATTVTTTPLNANVLATKGTVAPVEVFRKDYKPLSFVVTKVNMNFVIHDGLTVVTSELFIGRNPALAAATNGTTTSNGSNATTNNELVLDGDETCVKLMSLTMDGKDLEEGTDYVLAPGTLTLKSLVVGSVVKTVVHIVPEDNTQLSGLYKSGSMYCTQCEAMGFRRITYYPDRPDNMAIFEKVRLEANQELYPILLSNGNLIDSGIIETTTTTTTTKDGEKQRRHYAIWSDPFPKPSYLFCCVAGDLGSIQDSFTTMSGRNVKLEIFSEHANVSKLYHAMNSLKRAMKWDEDKFGREYDLDLYNIVAVDSFNMGAMENKGLNVFNTSCVLADKDTATDANFERIEGVIAHEYFHNWTGNRVTCRDWFQLTLKEGLTVFRDQEFSGDMGSPAVYRIEKVKFIRGVQFSEDAGPMSHPIRPESYISMDNFYTGTVYRKGAEVIRMYQTLLTKEGFRKGMDLYFERHDGCAVTCDDFLAAMADANKVDLTQFSLWYCTNGTPTIRYDYNYDDKAGLFQLTLTQKSTSEKPLHIPISVGLLDKKSGTEVVPTTVLNLKEMTQTFDFPNLKGDVMPSILRNFSAPVKLVPTSGVEDEELLAFLAARDTDGFNKWDAGQKLYTLLILQKLRGEESKKTLSYVVEAFGRTLGDKESTDYSIIAYALMLPSEDTLVEQVDVVDPGAIHKAREEVRMMLARTFQSSLQERYDELTAAMMANGQEFKIDGISIGRRRLRNICLQYLCSIRESSQEQRTAAELAMKHFKEASGMTDKVASLTALVSMDGEGASLREEAIQKFYDDAKGDALVLNKWFTIQAMADLPDILHRVKKLKEHKDFTLNNPNRCRSLISGFTANSAHFHDESGDGYGFLGDVLMELDKSNPRIASRLAGSFIRWKKFDENRGQLMKAQLEKLAAMEPISKDLYEIVNRGLK